MPEQGLHHRQGDQLGIGDLRCDPDLPSPDRLIDDWFDIADETLTAQREFAKALLAFGSPMIDAVSRAAMRTIEATQEATREATREAAEATTQATREAMEAATQGSREAPPEAPRTTRASSARRDG
ncbi:hypothetical protein [Pseudonocardia sp. T1-2H]|uniref:hypothetical protein n=1 Tax=Pseudonocardia sp. T1-2H TaxID=3128899 RepID=UPI0031010C28